MNDREQNISSSILPIDTKLVSIGDILYNVIRDIDDNIYLSVVDSNSYILLESNVIQYDVTLSLDTNYDIIPDMFILWYIDNNSVHILEYDIHGVIHRTRDIDYGSLVLALDAVVTPTRIIQLSVNLDDGYILTRNYVDLFNDDPDDIHTIWAPENSDEFTVTQNVRQTFNVSYNVDDDVYTARSLEQFTVKFVDYNGSIIKEETVIYDRDATAPTDPSRNDYRFIGWDISYTSVHQDLIVTALYTLDMNISIGNTIMYISNNPVIITYENNIFSQFSRMYIIANDIESLTLTIPSNTQEISLSALSSITSLTEIIDVSNQSISLFSNPITYYQDIPIRINDVELNFIPNECNIHVINYIDTNNSNLIFKPYDCDIVFDSGELKIIQQPVDPIACDGYTAKFSIVVAGGTPPYRYRWVVNGSDAPYNSPELSFIASMDQNGMSVYCEVTDSVGRSLTSDIITLTVKDCDKECLTTYYMGGPYNLPCHMFGLDKVFYKIP